MPTSRASPRFHPTIGTRAPADFAARFGATELQQPSEQVLHLADVAVTLDPMSTAFATTLMSGIPTVFIDFGIFELSAEARRLLSLRCPIVSGWFDDLNRAMVNWDELKAAIDAAPDFTSDEFPSTFFGRLG